MDEAHEYFEELDHEAVGESLNDLGIDESARHCVVLYLQLAHLLLLDAAQVERDLFFSDEGHLHQLLALLDVLYHSYHLLVLGEGGEGLFGSVGFGKVCFYLLEAFHSQVAAELLLRSHFAYQHLSYPQGLLIHFLYLSQRYLDLACIARFNQNTHHKVSRALICFEGFDGALLVFAEERNVGVVDVALLVAEQISDQVFASDSPVAHRSQHLRAHVQFGLGHCFEVFEGSLVNGVEVVEVFLQRRVAERGQGGLAFLLDFFLGLLVGEREGFFVDAFGGGRAGVAFEFLECGGEETGFVEEEVSAGCESAALEGVALLAAALAALFLHC